MKKHECHRFTGSFFEDFEDRDLESVLAEIKLDVDKLAKENNWLPNYKIYLDFKEDDCYWYTIRFLLRE